MRDKTDQEVILGCLDHIDEAIITLEKYQDVMTREERLLLMWLKNSHVLMNELVKTGTLSLIEK